MYNSRLETFLEISREPFYEAVSIHHRLASQEKLIPQDLNKDKRYYIATPEA